MLVPGTYNKKADTLAKVTGSCIVSHQLLRLCDMFPVIKGKMVGVWPREWDYVSPDVYLQSIKPTGGTGRTMVIINCL